MKKEPDGDMEREIVDSAEEIGAGLVGIIVVGILAIAVIIGIPFLIAAQLYR